MPTEPPEVTGRRHPGRRGNGGRWVITVVIVGFLWEIAHGRSGQPYALLGAIAGLAYLVALV
jgi:hypothetical protein